MLEWGRAREQQPLQKKGETKMKYKVTKSKRVSGGHCIDWYSGQLEYLATYFDSEAEANAAAARGDAQLLKDLCDGHGVDYADEDAREEVDAHREEFIHAIAVQDSQ